MTAGQHSIGAELPYRRSQLDKRTGSLVFDRHLGETVSGAPKEAQGKAAGQAVSAQDTPLDPGQVS